MADDSSHRGRRSPTPAALQSLGPAVRGEWTLPEPVAGQPLSRVRAKPAEVRVLLERSRESALADEPSQDYFAVRVDQRRLSFAVTDGVGSSFLGDVAAQILAAHVVDWLTEATDRSGLNTTLTAFLHQLARDMADRVAAWPLPASVSGLVRSALDQQRSYGSEAMIACGVVDLHGGRDAKVAIAWLGDTRLRVILRDGATTDYSGQTADRWSSRLGPRGEVRTQVWPVAQVARVIACTDGLLPELDAAVSLTDDELALRLDALARRPGNDDMALVDVGVARNALPPEQTNARSSLWRRLTDQPTGHHARHTAAGKTLRRLSRAATSAETPVPAPVQAPEPAPVNVPALADVPAPAGLRWQPSGGRSYEVSWTAVPAASAYEVEVCTEPTFQAPLLYAVTGTNFVVPPLGASVFVRVRSLVGSDPGPWTAGHDMTADSP